MWVNFNIRELYSATNKHVLYLIVKFKSIQLNRQYKLPHRSMDLSGVWLATVVAPTQESHFDRTKR